jgi:hypothetical protein
MPPSKPLDACIDLPNLVLAAYAAVFVLALGIGAMMKPAAIHH